MGRDRGSLYTDPDVFSPSSDYPFKLCESENKEEVRIIKTYFTRLFN